MKPGTYDLPIIWRGSTYPAITFTWLDAAGNPTNLNGWIPRARSRSIDFNPQIVDPDAGTVTISFTQYQTANFKLGVELYDWIWELPGTNGNAIRTVPYLQGKVQVKDPSTTTSSEQ